MEAEDSDALGRFLAGEEKEAEGHEALDPLVADEGLDDIGGGVAAFFAGDHSADAVFAIHIAADFVEEFCVAEGVPGFIAVLEFDFVEGVVGEVEEGAEEVFLGDAFDDEDRAVLDGAAVDDAGLDAGEAFLDALGGFAPLEIEGHPHLLDGGSGQGHPEQEERGQNRSWKSHW